MSTSQTANTEFDLDLQKILPRLHVYAMSLTHDRESADDLVQQTVMKALAGRRSFRPGTNFAGWMYRIERNEFLSELRRSRPRVDIDAVDQLVLSVPPRQDNGVVMREFMAAFRQLPVGARQALLLGHLNDYSQEQIARHSGIGVGAVKSRISRGRAMLARLLAPTINIPSGRSCPLNSTESCLPS